MLNIPDKVKLLFKRDSVKKNFRVHFVNGEYPDLTNADLNGESVKFTESLCQRDKFKFGLCEASTISFEVVNVPNIKGMIIECGLDVDVSTISPLPVGTVQRDDLNYPSYYIPYGIFKVESCQKQTDLSHRLVSAMSLENLSDIDLPQSLFEFRGVTWDTTSTVNFSFYDVIDLTFPSYAYARKIMSDSRESERNLVELSSISNSDYRIGLVYEKIFLSNEQLNYCMTTYKAVYDKNDYKRKLSSVRDEYGFAQGNTFRFDQDSLYGYFNAGDAFGFSLGDAYAKITRNSSGVITSIETDPDKFSRTSLIPVDNSPRTFFKVWKYKKASNTVSYSTGYKVRPTPSNPKIWQYIYDEGGFIAVPAELRVYRNSDNQLLRTETLGYFEFNQINIENKSDDAVISIEAVDVFRNLESLNVSTGKVTHTIRVDKGYSYQLYHKVVKFENWREIVESLIELKGCIGRFSRDGSFALEKVEMSSSLYPSDTLYPDDELFPAEVGGIILDRTTYRTAWFDDAPTHPIRFVSCQKDNITYRYEIPIIGYEEDEEPAINQITKTYTIDFSAGTLRSGVPLIITTSVPCRMVVFSGSGKRIDLRCDGQKYKNRFKANDWADFTRVQFDFNIAPGREVAVQIAMMHEVETYYEDEGVDYDVTNNHFIKNTTLTEEEINKILQDMGQIVGGLQYTPSNITCMGQPYLEAGDWVNVLGIKDSFDSLILVRTLSGVNTLVDSYESKGE